MYVVSYGNAFDGLSLVGPFKTNDDACAYADGDEYNIVEVASPAGTEVTLHGVKELIDESNIPEVIEGIIDYIRSDETDLGSLEWTDDQKQLVAELPGYLEWWLKRISQVQ
jgi:hypothetical protein